MKTFRICLAALYLGLAPIYWLPGVAPQILGNFKLALFVLTALLVILPTITERDFSLPRGLLGPVGLLLLLISLTSGLLQSDAEQIGYALKDSLLEYSALWMFYLLGRTAESDRILIFGSFLVAALCVPVVMSKYLSFPDFHGPAEYVAPHLWVSGFSGLRTGWSNGTALYTAPLLFVLADQRRGAAAWLVKGGALAAIGAIVSSQFAVSGRAGLLASVLILIIGLNSRGHRWLLLAIGILVGVFIAGNGHDLAVQMRITRADSHFRRADDLNTISAGRLSGDSFAIQRGLERPFTGHGLGRVMLGRDEIHNLWIRMFVEAGVFGVLIPLLIVLVALRTAWRAWRQRPLPAPERFRRQVVLAALVAGLSITMVEPRMVFGTFQITLLWWVMAARAARSVERPRAVRQVQPQPVLAYLSMAAP